MSSPLVELADRKVPMVVSCRAVEMHVDDHTSKKLYCPFGEFSHSDQGDEAAFRVYPDHAFCFACWAYYSPVSLYVAKWEVAEDTAAETLLSLAGITPESYTERWEELQQPVRMDYEALREALITRCARDFPGWGYLQYHDNVASYLARCLGLRVAVRNESDARQWLEACSEVMRAIVRRTADAQV